MTGAWGLEVYRIGYPWWFRHMLVPYRAWLAGISDVKWGRRATSDRWGRCWQAEWIGCTTAVRGWTKAGTYNRALRAMRRTGVTVVGTSEVPR